MSYAGCEMLVATSGLAGVVLQREGELAGCIWDVFAHPQASAGSVYGLLMLAVEKGCNRVVTYDHLLAARFFEGFGFEVVARSPGCLHMILLMEVFQARESALGNATRSISARSDGMAPDRSACAYCGLAPHEKWIYTEHFGGFICARCSFVTICGALTPPPPPPPLGPVPLLSRS